ncbi:MAG: PDZ domain-containing protein [Phycisphaerales bacterium]|nr:PDZ domain-containing protein [Phycisphaerales bacterium]
MKIQTLLPAAIVAIAAVLVLVVTPRTVRSLSQARVDAERVAAKGRLSERNALEEVNQATRDVASIVEPSVLALTAKGSQSARGGAPFFNTGSAWVYDVYGHIVTNGHVVDGAKSIDVQLHTGQIIAAQLVGIDLKTDIAVLRIEADDLTPAQRSIDIPTQGEMVFAFGSPFDFRFSMSSGIVSGIGRSAGLADVDYENFIQVDAAINPGNSGGPLTDIYGRVIGMNTAIATGRGSTLGQGQFGGIGLAIPMDIIEFVVGQLIETGEVEKGFSGVAVQSVSSILAPQMRNPLFRCIAEHFNADGAVVTRVSPSSPAERAGLRIGDVITSIDGVKTGDADKVPSIIGTRRPGQKVVFQVWRPLPDQARGEEQQISVELAKRDPQVESEDLADLLRNYGFAKMVTSTTEACALLNVAHRRGVLVQEVTADSNLAGLVPAGAIIVAVGGQSVSNVEDFYVRLARGALSRRGIGRASAVLSIALPTGKIGEFEIPLR